MKLFNLFKKQDNGLESFKNAKTVQGKLNLNIKKALVLSVAVGLTTQINNTNDVEEMFAEIEMAEENSFIAENVIMPEESDTNWELVSTPLEEITEEELNELKAEKQAIKFKKPETKVKNQLKPKLKP